MTKKKAQAALNAPLTHVGDIPNTGLFDSESSYSDEVGPSRSNS